MSLFEQNVELDFSGMDAGIDERLLSPGKLSRLDNGYFDNNATIKRRSGIVVSQQAVSAGDFGIETGNISRIDKYQKQLILEGINGLYSRSEVDVGQISLRLLDRLRNGNYDVRRRTNRASLETDFIAPFGGDKSLGPVALDSAYSGPLSGVSFWVWERMPFDPYAVTHEIAVLVRNERTKQILVQQSFALASTVAAPRVVWVASQSKFYLYYYNGSNIVVRYLPIATMELSGEISTSLGTSEIFDVFYQAEEDKLLLSWKDVSNDLNMASVDPVDGYTVLQSDIATATNITALSAIIVHDIDTGINWYITAWNDGTNNIYVSNAAFDSSGTITTTTLAVGHTVGRIDTVVTTSNSWCDVVYEQKTTGPNMHIEFFEFEPPTNIIVSGPHDVCGGARLAGKCIANQATDATYANVSTAFTAFNEGSATTFIIDLHNLKETGSVQITSFMTQSGVQPGVYGRVMPEETAPFGDVPLCNRLPAPFCPEGEPTSDTDNQIFTFPLIGKKEPEFFKPIGLDVTIWDYYVCSATLNFKAQLSSIDLSPGLYLPGACPLYYDGNDLMEGEFSSAPEIASIASVAGSGVVAGETYSIRLVYVFRDSAGRVHRSAPSSAKSLEVGVGDSALEVTFYDQLITRKNFVRLEMYRTKLGGTVYYHDPLALVTSSTITTFLPDDQLGEVLYTEGGVLDNVASSSYGQGCLHQGRVFQIMPDRQTICYSDVDLKDQPPNFSEVYRLRVPGDKGKLCALASMDDKLIAWCTAGIYAFTGSGPNLLGAQNNYSEPFLVEGSIGCSDGQGNSLARDPEGIWFMSPQGLRHLNRGLAITRKQDGRFQGSETDGQVLEPNGQFTQCIKALPVLNTTQVRFFDGTNQWVWDYRFGQWSRFTNFGCLDAATGFDGTVYHSRRSFTPGQRLFQEAPGTTSDYSGVYQMVMVTPWIHLAGVQGLQRVRRLFFLANLDDQDHPIDPTTILQPFNIAVYEDYDNNAAKETATIAMSDAAVGQRKPIQFEYHIANQKCTAIKFIINDAPIEGTQINYKLTKFMLQVGLKRGGSKLTPAKKI